jgi:PAS domain S-box-containing protein
MMRRLTSGQFSRRALLLFFIVSLLPAITVSVAWYTLAQSNNLIFIGNYVAPIALLGLGPALILGILFAELLANPIKRLHQGILQIGKGNLSTRIHFNRISEFQEMGEALNAIAINLQGTISQKDSQNELITAERNKLTSVLNNMTDGVFALDRTDRIMLFNHAASEITGHSIEQVAGRPVEQILPLHRHAKPTLVEWLGSIPPDSSETKQWTDLELADVKGNIHRVNLEVVTLAKDPNGIRLLGTFHDRTKDLELEDKELNFVALAAHELRTPLTTIKGYIDILQTELGKTLDADHREMLARSMLGVNELTHLINNLLNVSRIENGDLNYQFEPTNWSTFIKDLEPELKQRTTHHDRKLRLIIPDRLPTVMVDHLAISEIFYNLVDNAIHYTAEGDMITIEVHKVHDGIDTTVIDHGTGIPREALGQLFEKFYRVGGLKSRGGTGLGLYICKQIAEAHHGYVWVESEEGTGSTFGLHLPLDPKVASSSATKDNKAKIIRGTHGWIKTNSPR